MPNDRCATVRCCALGGPTIKPTLNQSHPAASLWLFMSASDSSAGVTSALAESCMTSNLANSGAAYFSRRTETEVVLRGGCGPSASRGHEYQRNLVSRRGSCETLDSTALSTSRRA